MTNIVSSDRPLAVLDTEIYVDYFLFKAKRVDNGKIADVEMYEGHPLDTDRVRAILERYEIVTFNGRNFDIPMIYAALKGFSCEKLKHVCDAIILENMKPWDVERAFGFKIPRNLKHIDLIEVAPGQASLKIYGGRIHSRKMQDLPIEPNASIQPDQRALLSKYCGNDLEVTELLLRKLTPQLELRRALSIEYGDDYMSKSDAQIAEAVIKSKMSELIGCQPSRPTPQAGKSFDYDPPKWMEFETESMWKVFNTIKNTPFKVAPTGKVNIPDPISELEIKIGGGVYRMGIGGLHSSESALFHIADDDTLLKDRDVSSYYPSIILNNKIYPEGLGPQFLTVYEKIVRERLSAKRGSAEIRAKIKVLENEIANYEE